ncbi:MAG: OmpA family protein [Flavobacteriales bacterium]|nr:OmpA family protein [Flavobacteriales bacterium]
MGNPLEIIITHLDTSINTAHVEFAPVILDDTTLLYSALKSRKVMYYTTDDEDSLYGQQPVRQMYVAHKDFDDWSGQELLQGPFNEPGVECGNGTFSPDKNRFYFTKCIPNKKKVICSIFVSRKDSVGNWTVPEALPSPINNEEFTSTQPTIGTHPKYGLDVIYYVSDRNGGKGGLDIWYTYVRDKKGVLIYQKPKNCGKSINTVGTDVTPFFDMETKQMYFSSNGHPGIGGLDIFYTTGQLNKWGDPANIGYPINNKEDDLDFTIAPSQEEGFFISNRPGGTALKSETCCDDLYHFYYTQYIKIYVTGSIFEETDSTESQEKILENATATLFLVDTASGEKMEIKKAFTNEKGDYIMKLEQGNQYILHMSKEGYFKLDVPFSTETIEKSDTFKLADLWLGKLPDAPVVIKNIYYQFDKDHLTPETKTVIDTTIYKILVENPEIVIELSSHTDSKGTDKYNHDLSQRRAESVVKYLISKGIDKKR